jgi:hypothetical protein
MGRIFVTGNAMPGVLYMIDPTQSAGPATVVASNLGQQPLGLGFDGTRLWTANLGASVSIITPSSSLPWPAQTVALPGPHSPQAVLFDGHDVWIADNLGKLLRMDANGGIAQTVDILPGSGVFFPVFDGENIWVPARSQDGDQVVVVRASTGEIIQRLSGNGLEGPYAAAFDGQRVLVTNGTQNQTGRLSVWRAADLTPLGSADVFSTLGHACSDGDRFWFTIPSFSALSRF